MSEETQEEVAPTPFDDEFDLEADYKATPLIAPGTYKGNIINASINEGLGAIVVDAQLQGNEGHCSDGETPVDGMQVSLRIWLPKPADAHTNTPAGKMTKKQWKINNMKECLDKLGVTAPTMTEIKAQLENGDWIRDDVTIDVEFNVYKGETTNQAKSIYI